MLIPVPSLLSDLTFLLIRHIDTSLNYGNQVGTGIAIKRSKIPRKELYITSKYDAIDGADPAHEIHTTLNQVRRLSSTGQRIARPADTSNPLTAQPDLP